MTDAPRTMPTTFARLEAANKRLQAELDAANESVNQWMEYYHNAAAERDAVTLWAKEAYTRLNALMTIGVSMTPDAVTAKLLQDAPEAVKGGE